MTNVMLNFLLTPEWPIYAFDLKSLNPSSGAQNTKMLSQNVYISFLAFEMLYLKDICACSRLFYDVLMPFSLFFNSILPLTFCQS